MISSANLMAKTPAMMLLKLMPINMTVVTKVGKSLNNFIGDSSGGADNNARSDAHDPDDTIADADGIITC